MPKFEDSNMNTVMISMKKLSFLVILAAMLLVPVGSSARNKKKDKKYQKTEVILPEDTPVKQEPKPVSITNAPKQLEGEWNIKTLRKKTVISTERPYIYLNFDRYQVYGNNGCNNINGNFHQQDYNISFKDMITTNESCHSSNTGRDIMKALKDVQQFRVTTLYGMETLYLMNGKGQEIMTLTRQNLSFLDGAWVVKELDGENVMQKNARLVIDTPMKTIHGNTGCNIINGIIHIDTDKDFAIQFEDIHSNGNLGENIDVETALLIALEQTESAKRINDNEMALLNRKGRIIIVLSKLNLAHR